MTKDVTIKTPDLTEHESRRRCNKTMFRVDSGYFEKEFLIAYAYG